MLKLFNTTNSVHISLYALIITFSLCIVLLFIIKPYWIYIIKDNKPVLSWVLIISYSSILSILCSVIILIIFGTNNKLDNKSYFSDIPIINDNIALRYQ